jgi:hypothetical protein
MSEKLLSANADTIETVKINTIYEETFTTLVTQNKS